MRQLLTISIFTLALTVPTLASAAGLVPCGGPGEDACNTDFVVSFVSGLINFLISMLGVIAMIILVIAGIRLVTSAGSETEWTKAKSMFTNVIIGIILILAAWLIVDTVMRVLTGEGLNYWSDFSR